MTQPAFSSLLLIGRPNTQGVPETLTKLCDYLASHPVKIAVESVSAELFTTKVPHTVMSTEDINGEIDLIIVVGGDGSMLHAAHIAAQHSIPVLGINRGRLGFLTDIHPDHLEEIGDVLTGQYKEEHRFFLQATIETNDAICPPIHALNDVVLSSGDEAHMIEFHTYVDDDLLYRQRADGLIIATPTGSTAYALSGGGPILTPELNAFVLVPMFPHTLSSRPIVISANSTIKIVIDPSNDCPPRICNDGMEQYPVPAGTVITLQQHQPTLRLIHPLDNNYFTTLREKLGWERQAMRA